MCCKAMVRSILLVIMMCAGFVHEATFACSCAVPSLELRYQGSQNVFTALITGGEATDERVGNSPKLRTYFSVTESFKGTIPFAFLSSHVEGSSCGISLQIGVEYLIYAPDTGAIGLCSGIVPVSGDSEQVVATGKRDVEALRKFKSGEHKSLAEPWRFFEHQGACTLSGRFPYGDLKWSGGIYVTYWTRVPDTVIPSDDKPHLKAGFTEMSISVPGRDDLVDYPLTLTVGDQRYTAQWKPVEYSRSRYFVESDEIADLIAGLTDASEIRIRSAHPKYGDVDTAASLENAGDSVALMHECIATHVDREQN